MTISILGCGWLGLATAKHLLQQGWQVKGSTTSPEKMSLLKQNGIQPFLCHISSDGTTNLTEKEEQDFFSSEYLLINIPPGRRNANVETEHPKQIQAIIAKAKQCNTKRVLFISSTGVYGDKNRVVDEADVLEPTRNSTKALVKVEAFLRNETTIEVTILRMGGLVGGDRKAGRFFAGKKEVKNGDALINMIHQMDCVAIIEQILAQEVWGETFNAVADKHPTRKAFYEAQARKDGYEIPTFAPIDEPSPYKIVSNKKLKERLNYTFLKPDPMDF